MVYAPLLSLAALVLLLNPLPAIGGQTEDVNRVHNGGRCPCLESDEQVKSRTNAYLVIESPDDAMRERLNQLRWPTNRIMKPSGEVRAPGVSSRAIMPFWSVQTSTIGRPFSKKPKTNVIGLGGFPGTSGSAPCLLFSEARPLSV